MTPEELQAYANQHLKNFEVFLTEMEHSIRQVWMLAPVDSDREAGAKSVMNKLANVRKAFVHEFGSKENDHV